MAVLYNVVVLFFVFNVLSANEIRLIADYTGYQGMVEMVGAISRATTSSVLSCATDCAGNDKRVTFFFNFNNKQCVMHSKHFKYQPPSTRENGWKYYITKDVTGRCPSAYFYYRNFDLCYTFDEITTIDSAQIKTKCSDRGAQLAAVTSLEKYEYFVHILANHTYIRVFLQGKRVNANEWMLDDGTPLTYLNWFPSQPDNKGNNENCLELKDDDKLQDIDCVKANPAVFICEL